VSSDIRRRCAAGAFTDGVPGEHELCREYDVSRHTIREALRALRAEGVISSHRGRGSVVPPSAFSQRLGAVYSLFRSVESQGAIQVSDVLRQEAATDPEVAERLGLAPDTRLVVLERLRRADGIPLAHDTSWLPYDLAAPLLDADFRHTALYDELARLGTVVDAGHERIVASVGDSDVARLLDVPSGAPILRIQRLGRAGDRSVEWRETSVRGDRFALETEWTTHRLSLAMTSPLDPPTPHAGTSIGSRST
jgi:GntR family transcriptional regulator